MSVTTENNCKTCFFWERDKFIYRVGKCKNSHFINRIDGESGRSTSKGLSYWSESGEGNGFEVGKNFGCIHHRVRNI